MVRKRQHCKSVGKSVPTAGNSSSKGPGMRYIWGCFGDKKRRPGVWNIKNKKKVEGDGGQRRHEAPNYAGSYKPQLGVGIWLLAVGSLWVVLNMGMMSSELYFRKTTLASLKGAGRQRDREAHA